MKKTNVKLSDLKSKLSSDQLMNQLATSKVKGGNENEPPPYNG